MAEHIFPGEHTLIADYEPMASSRERMADATDRIEHILSDHVVDLQPERQGQSDKLKRLGDPLYGIDSAESNRPVPQLTVERITMQPGQLLAIVGPNGAGKSTLFDAIMERGADFKIDQLDGAISIGKSVHERPGLRVARLDQEELLGPIADVMTRDVLDYSAEYFKDQLPVVDDDWLHERGYERNLSNQQAHQRIEVLRDQIAVLFDMDEFMDTTVNHLSGGERTKLALFMTLLSEPDVLLLDEPTNHLDLGSIAKLSELFHKYTQAGVTVASISHVEWFLKDAGRSGVVEVTWDKTADHRAARQTSQDYATYEMAGRRESRPILQGDIPWPAAEYYHYRQGQQVVDAPSRFSLPHSPLRGATLPSVWGGQRLLITGANGTGKTTLFESIVHSRNQYAPRRVNGAQAAYLPQFWPEAFVQGTIGEFYSWVKQIASPHATHSAAYINQPPENLFIDQAKSLRFGNGQIGDAWLRRPFGALSGGEQRALWFLAVGSLPDVDMLILDEPTNHMDHMSRQKITQAIKRFPGAVLLATHDPDLIRDMGDREEIQAGKAPIHIDLTKKDGRTAIHQIDMHVDTYVYTVRQQARAEARRFRVEV